MPGIFNYQIALIIAVLIVLSSCKQDGGDRTVIRSSDDDIPADLPKEGNITLRSPDIPADQLFREACLNGYAEEVNEYLEGGVDVNQVDQDGRSGLMLASFNGHLNIVRKLLNEGACINEKDYMGRTALMYASTGHYPKTVEVLLSRGADPDIVDEAEGFTALMFAGAEGNIEVTRILLQHNADPDIKDKDGDTAESFAKQNGHNEVAELLKAASK